MAFLLPISVKEIAVNLNIAEHKVFENIDSIAQRKLSGLQCNREQLIANAFATLDLPPLIVPIPKSESRQINK